MQVLIAPDKFKGTLTAPEAAQAIAAGWRSERPQDSVELCPISDGGDGFGELLAQQTGAQPQRVATVDAAGRAVDAVWWWEPRSKLAVIESARVVGLAMLPPGRFHPFALDTYGLGAVLAAARKMKPRSCLVGIGGSATNDGGFGLLRSVGWSFLDKKGRRIERWTDLGRLDRVERPSGRPGPRDLIVAVDVTNRLLGVRGATRIYGPQKGIRPEDMPQAERCLRRLARKISALGSSMVGIEHIKGAGAAGGLGYGFLVGRLGRLQSGFRVFAGFADLRPKIRAADLVITGEGALDLATVNMGKGVGGLAGLCGRLRRPCVALAGVVTVRGLSRRKLAALHGIVPGLASAADSMARPAYWLERLATVAARDWTARESARTGSVP
jgi:glycerate kinase